MFHFKQSINIHAVRSFFNIFTSPKLIKPTYVDDFTSINKIIEKHNESNEIPIKYIVFDKDNTLTLPYDLSDTCISKHTLIAQELELCRKIHGESNVAILSNSLGSSDDAPDYKLVRKFHENTKNSIPIVCHGSKKPNCFEELIDHFRSQPKNQCVPNEPRDENGCDNDCESVPFNTNEIHPESICIIGDRILTDIVFSNLHGMKSILVPPIDESVDPMVVRAIRSFELFLLRHI